MSRRGGATENGEKMRRCVPPRAIAVKAKGRRIRRIPGDPGVLAPGGLIGHTRKCTRACRESPSTRISSCENDRRRTPSPPGAKETPASGRGPMLLRYINQERTCPAYKGGRESAAQRRPPPPPIMPPHHAAHAHHAAHHAAVSAAHRTLALLVRVLDLALVVLVDVLADLVGGVVGLVPDQRPCRRAS